ncbi:MAG: hypothetical protein AVDCRST_MAG37-944 [uncultured Rubrobacteraceae bacterium]|uniref:Uncharacterized protein n=1 Tax=uncultured Rubrobacteraceae bacterium TaxID=349277 RepID=A0A6J4Q5X9_9ACTN|nr:MAG: hypothetical protein AVDCRST_MAG37-944 [uncultured Rubrobacteraceae bacterium]
MGCSAYRLDSPCANAGIALITIITAISAATDTIRSMRSLIYFVHQLS